MNQPPYFLKDVLKEVVDSMATELGTALHYDYGYIEEINTKLLQMNVTDAQKALKYPLIWLVAPYTQKNGQSFDYYGKARIRVLFINQMLQGKSPERYDVNYKGVLWNLKEKFITALNEHEAIKYEVPGTVEYDETFSPYWGERQKSVFNDIVDVLEISDLEIIINNNQNC